MDGACRDDADWGALPREYHHQPTATTTATNTAMMIAATPGLMFCFTSDAFRD